jgi:hypothetical protein
MQRRPEATPVEAPTFQISRADYYVVGLVAADMNKSNAAELAPVEALEAVSSLLFKPGPDNGIEFRPSAIGLHRQVIAEGYVGNEVHQPDAVITFLGAMATERFILEVMRDQTRLDKLRRRNAILFSLAYGEPRPIPRKI